MLLRRTAKRYFHANSRRAALVSSAANAVAADCQRYVHATPRCAALCLHQILPQAPSVLQKFLPLQPAAVGAAAPSLCTCCLRAAPTQRRHSCCHALLSCMRRAASCNSSLRPAASRFMAYLLGGRLQVGERDLCPCTSRAAPMSCKVALPINCISLSLEQRKKGSQQAHGPHGNARGMPGQPTALLR